jgi:hypothetical protein
VLLPGSVLIHTATLNRDVRNARALRPEGPFAGVADREQPSGKGE